MKFNLIPSRLLYLFFFTFLILTSLTIFSGNKSSIYGQEKSPTVRFLTKRGYYFSDTTQTHKISVRHKRWPDTLYYNTVYIAPLLATPTFPFSFSKIERRHGKVQVSSTISVGIGYAWFFGDFIFNETDKITVDQNASFGLLAEIGLQNNLMLNRIGSVVTGGFVGVGPFVLSFGYDYITKAFSLGLGQKFDFYSLYQNFLRPIGRVREANKHKSSAIPIKNE